MTTQSITKTPDRSSKHWTSQSVTNKSNIKRQLHKVNPLYETSFDDVVTEQYVRGYN